MFQIYINHIPPYSLCLGPVSEQEVPIGRVYKVGITRTQLNTVAANNFDRENKVMEDLWQIVCLLSNFRQAPLKMLELELLVYTT